MGERILPQSSRKQDTQSSTTLQPQTLDEFIGQERLKANLSILIEAAKARGEALDHVLLYGPPGLGKRVLATIIAGEMKVGLRRTSGIAIEATGDLAAILTNMHKGDILIVDDIHRLGHETQEFLRRAMEDYALDIVIGKGPTVRAIRLKLPPFTIVGVTSRLALVIPSLRASFGAIYRVGLYESSAMEAFVRRSARILGLEIGEAGTKEIAHRAGGTTAVASRLLRRVRDYALVHDDGIITQDVVKLALDIPEMEALRGARSSRPEECLQARIRDLLDLHGLVKEMLTAIDGQLDALGYRPPEESDIVDD